MRWLCRYGLRKAVRISGNIGVAEATGIIDGGLFVSDYFVKCFCNFTECTAFPNRVVVGTHQRIIQMCIRDRAEPVYAYPELVSEYGISGAVMPDEIERLLAENPDAEAVILPSPNYYGICSDIAAIADAVHHAGKVLIVDQAHGAHLKRCV